MIRVTVELVPGGDESDRRTLGTMELVNTGEGTPDFGIFEGSVRLVLEGDPFDDAVAGVRVGHSRAWNVWVLVQKALERVRPDEAFGQWSGR